MQDRTLESMFPVVNPSQRPTNADDVSGEQTRTPLTNGSPKTRAIGESECYLTSIRTLRQLVSKGKHRSKHTLLSPPRYEIHLYLDLSEILEKHIFVGIVDMDRCLSLIQHSTKLYLVNHGALT